MKAPVLSLPAIPEHEAIDQLLADMQANQLDPGQVKLDDQVHRFSSNGKPRDDAGWYIGHMEPVPVCTYGNWRTGETMRWRVDIGRQYTPSESRVIQALQTEQLEKARTDRLAAQKKAAAAALSEWEAAKPAPYNHPYLLAKAISETGLRVTDDASLGPDVLLVPAFDRDGKLSSYQRISAKGRKLARAGAKMAGCAYQIGALDPINDASGPLGLCEGMATGKTINAITGLPITVAFSTSNLMAVGQNLREKFPKAEIRIYADDDWQTPGNPGITSANEVAARIQAVVFIPDFSSLPVRPEKATDFNDAARLLDIGLVEDMLEYKSETTESPSVAPETGDVNPSGIVIPGWSECVIPAYQFVAEDIPPRKLLLDPFLPEGGIVMIYAWRGIGKSLVAHEIACAVASGEPWLDFKPQCEIDPDDGLPHSVGKKVLIVDGELAQADMQRRLKMVFNRYPSADKNISLYMADRYWQTGGSPLNLADPLHHETIFKMAEGHDMVVFDNLSTLHRAGSGESDDMSWQDISTLLRWLKASGITSLLIHHSGKGGKHGRGADQRGTSAREDMLDTSVRLERPPNWDEEEEARFEWHFVKSRGFQQAPALVLTPVFKLTGDDPQPVLTGWDWETKKTRLQDDIIKLKAEGMSKSAIARELDCSRRWVGKVLSNH